MTTIYLIRHCEALGNVMRIFQGITDCDISENGAKQLELLSERFKDIHIDAVYSSPLIRTIKTAEAVAGPKNLIVEAVDGLIELDGGIVEGQPFLKSFKENPELAEIWNNHPEDFAPEGGEPMRNAYERIWETILNIAEKSKGKTVALTTHGGVTRCLLCRILYNDISRLNDVGWSENTAVTKIEFDDNLKPTLVYMNDHSHVPDEFMPKRSRLVKISEMEE